MSRSPSRLPHRRAVRTIAATIAARSVSPYAWTDGSGPGRSNSPDAGDGIEATSRIVAADAAVRVVVLTSFSDRRRILQALDAGAIGYVLKDAAPDELEKAIHAAARGEAPLDPKAAHALISDRTAVSPGASLSDREREVLVLVMEGYQNKHIARRLGISEKTVKAHLTSVFRQIGVTDRTQAALWAQRHDLRADDDAR